MDGQYGFDAERDSQDNMNPQSHLKSATPVLAAEGSNFTSDQRRVDQEVPYKATSTMVRESRQDDDDSTGNTRQTNNYDNVEGSNSSNQETTRESSRPVNNQRTPPQSPADFRPVEETRMTNSASTRPVSSNSLLNLGDDDSKVQGEKEVFGDHYWQQEQERKQKEQNMSPKGSFSQQNKRNPSDVNINDFDMDKRGGLHGAGSRPRPVSHSVADILMWKNLKDSAIVFSLGVFLLFCLTRFSLISIIAYASLAVLIVAGGYVFVRQMMHTMQNKSSAAAAANNEEGAQQQQQKPQEPAHPFYKMLQKDVVIQPEVAHQQLDTLLQPINQTLLRMRNLYLADSLAQTLKLAFIMYIMTYIGRWFNLLTLVSIGWVLAFIVPRVYTMYRPQIDCCMKTMETQVKTVMDKVMGMVNQQKNKVMQSKNGVGVDGAAGVKGGATSKSEVKTTVTVKGKKNL